MDRASTPPKGHVRELRYVWCVLVKQQFSRGHPGAESGDHGSNQEEAVWGKVYAKGTGEDEHNEVWARGRAGGPH